MTNKNVHEFLIGLICSLMLCLFFACSSEEADVERGHRYIDRGDYDKAIQNYSLGLEINPSNPDIYFFRGLAWWKKGNLDSAIIDFTKAINLEPTYIKAYINRGSIWKEKGEPDKALFDYHKVIEINPGDYQAYLVRAELLLLKRCFDKAVSDYTVAIENNVDSEAALIGRADAYYHMHDYKDAINDCKKAIELNPNYSFAYNNLAWLYSTCIDEKYRDGDKAIENAKKAVGLNPTSINLHTLAAAYAENNMFENAANIMEEIVANKDSIQDDFQKHLILFRNNNPLRVSPGNEALKPACEDQG